MIAVIRGDDSGFCAYHSLEQVNKSLITLIDLFESNNSMDINFLFGRSKVQSTVADPETSERGGQETWNISRCAWRPSFFGYFLQARGGGMGPPPLDPLLNQYEFCNFKTIFFSTFVIYIYTSVCYRWFVIIWIDFQLQLCCPIRLGVLKLVWGLFCLSLCTCIHVDLHSTGVYWPRILLGDWLNILELSSKAD